MTTFAPFMGPGLSPVQKTFAAEKEVELIENQVGAVREVVRENVKLAPPRREPEEGKSEFVVMPIPVANPTIGAGLAAIGMFLYKASENAPTSNTTVGGRPIFPDVDFVAESKVRSSGLNRTWGMACQPPRQHEKGASMSPILLALSLDFH